MDQAVAGIAFFGLPMALALYVFAECLYGDTEPGSIVADPYRIRGFGMRVDSPEPYAAQPQQAEH